MLIILRSTLKSQRWLLLVTAGLVAALGGLVSFSYDAFGGETFELLAEQLPRGVTALLKAEGDALLV